MQKIARANFYRVLATHISCLIFSSRSCVVTLWTHMVPSCDPISPSLVTVMMSPLVFPVHDHMAAVNYCAGSAFKD